MSATKSTAVVQSTPVEVPSVNPLHGEPILDNLSRGALPTNEQLNLAIDRTRESIDHNARNSNLNSKGEQLAQDTEDLLGSAQRFINEHNKDGKLQDLYRHTQEASHEAQKEAARLGATTSGSILPPFLSTGQKYLMKNDAKHGLNYGKHLALYIFRSGEFKTLLLDLIEFFQNVLLDSTEKLNRLGDSLKTDIKKEDTHMRATRTEAEHVKEEAKDAARSKAYEWNEERRKEVYGRFRALLERASRQPEFQNLVNIFFKWMDQMKHRAILTKDRVQERVEAKIDRAQERIQESKENFDETPFEKMLQDVREIVDEFAGRGSFDQFYNETWDLYVDLVHDAEASRYFTDLQLFVEDAVNHPDTLNLDAKTHQGQELVERGRTLMQSEKYRAKFARMFDNGSFLVIKIKNDETTQDFKEKLIKFGEHFALDSQGRPDLYVIQESLLQLKELAYPIIREKLGHLKIAKIVGATEKVDYSIEDLVISVPDLLPRSFELQTKTDLQVDFEDLKSRNGYVKASLDLRKLKPVFKGVKFWFKKKTFPKIEDHGVIDVDLSAGEGTRVKVVWKIVTATDKPFSFSLVNVKCTVDKMDVDIRDAKHEILDKLATSLFIGKLKSSVAKAMVDGIVGALQPINNQMNQWFATRPVHSLKDRANDQIHDAFDRTNAAIKDRPVDRVVERVTDTLDSVKISVVSTTENLKERASANLEDAKFAVQDVKSSVQQTAAIAQDRVGEASTEVHRATGDFVGEASTPVYSTGEQFVVQDSSEKGWHFEWYSTPANAAVIEEKVEVMTTTSVAPL